MLRNHKSEIFFKFRSFAGVETCDIALTPLTVIAGPNSAGKTYVVYAIYSLIKNLRHYLVVPISAAVIRKLVSSGSTEFDISGFENYDYSSDVSRNFVANLPYFFSVNEEFFSGATVEIKVPKPSIRIPRWLMRVVVRKDMVLEINKPENSTVCSFALSSESLSEPLAGIDHSRVPLHLVRSRLLGALAQLTFPDLLFKPFPITSERTGISLFWKELDISKNQIIDKLIASKGRKIDPWELIDDETSRYALPITDNIDIARDSENVSKTKSFISSQPEDFKYIRSVFDKIAGGKYRYSQDGISFEYGVGKHKSVIPIYVASSSTKSLFLLDLYINNIASKGDVLIFDEPELNLHLSNQRLMAQLIARLVSLGVNVLITTHSDFLVRELNNSVMLSTKFEGREELMRKHGIDEREVLRPNDVSGYLITKGRHLESVEVNKFGINMASIDEAISVSAGLQGEIVSLMTSVDADQ